MRPTILLVFLDCVWKAKVVTFCRNGQKSTTPQLASVYCLSKGLLTVCKCVLSDYARKLKRWGDLPMA